MADPTPNRYVLNGNSTLIEVELGRLYFFKEDDISCVVQIVDDLSDDQENTYELLVLDSQTGRLKFGDTFTVSVKKNLDFWCAGMWKMLPLDSSMHYY